MAVAVKVAWQRWQLNHAQPLQHLRPLQSLQQLRQLRRLPTWLVLLDCAGPTLAAGPTAPFEPPPAAAAAAAASAPMATETHTQGQGNVAALPAERDASGLLGVQRSGATARALIDGRWWPVGSQLRGAQLIQIQHHQATLRHPDGRLEVLALYSSVSNSAGTAGKAVSPLPNQPARTP